MTTVEVSLPEEVDAELEFLVEEGEFISRDQAVTELLSMALATYHEESPSEPIAADVFTQTVVDQHDPADRQGPQGRW